MPSPLAARRALAFSVIAMQMGCAATEPEDLPPTHLAFQGSLGNAQAGNTFSVNIAVRDASEGLATQSNATVTVGIASGTGATGATLMGTLSAQASGGIATFNDLKINKSGAGYRLVATSAGLTLATSSSFDIAPGPAVTAAFTVQPRNTVVNVPFSPTIQVTFVDQFDNPVVSSAGQISMLLELGNPSAQLRGTRTVNAVNGVATFPGLYIDQTGTGFRLNAGGPGIASGRSALFDITATSPGPRLQRP